jgi:hypothetical protein
MVINTLLGNRSRGAKNVIRNPVSLKMESYPKVVNEEL